MLLSSLFDNVPDIDIKQLSIDSRVPMKDCIFFCIDGIKDDGHQFVDEAIKNGANVIVYEKDIKIEDNAIFIKVDDTADCLNKISSKFYNYPAKKLETFVVGGCNGFTSVSYILQNIINNFKPCASIGQRGIIYGDHQLMSNVPTLTILDNQKYLNEFVKNNIKACVLEANAMSLSYKKIDSVEPNIFIYTNTNETDGDFQEIGTNYYDSMCSYLYTLEKNTAILLNKDDKSYDELSKCVDSNLYSYGFNEDSTYVISDVVLGPDGSKFNLKYKDNIYGFKTKLIGLTNVYNIVAAIAGLSICNYDLNEISLILSFLEPLEGIMEPISIGQKYNVIIDKAADYNSIESLFKFAKSITNQKNRILVVWGINSSDDEDNLKRFLNLCKKYVNRLIITENNTYNSDMATSIKDNLKIFKPIRPLVIEDRKIAIGSAVELMNDNDTLLVIGKGEQKYIYRNLGKEAYDGDKNVTIKAINIRLNEEKEY